MRLWGLDKGQGTEYSGEQGSRDCPSSLGIGMCLMCLLSHSVSYHPAEANLSAAPQSCLSACVQARILPSLPFPFPMKTEQVTLFPWLDPHPALSSPSFLASADSLSSGEGGGKKGWCIILHPGPIFLGIVLGCPLPALCPPSTHNPSRPLVFSWPKAREPHKGESLEEPSLTETEVDVWVVIHLNGVTWSSVIST